MAAATRQLRSWPRPGGTVAAILATFVVRFEDQQFTMRLDWMPVWLPPFVVYAGAVYFAFRLHESVALHLAAGIADHRPRDSRARPVAPGAGLRSAGAELLRHVLFRQDHYRALLAGADGVSRRSAYRLSLFPLHAHAAPVPRSKLRADAIPRPRRRRRSAVARDRKRCSAQDLAGRHPLAGTFGSASHHPRRSGARQFRGFREVLCSTAGARRLRGCC